MIDYSRTYTQAEVDRIIEQTRDEVLYELESLEAFSKLPSQNSTPVEDSVRETDEVIRGDAAAAQPYDRRNHARFPLDWKENAIPSKILYDDQAGFFNYYARNNRIEGYIVYWQHKWFSSRGEAYDWIHRMVYKKTGPLHNVGIQDAVATESIYGDKDIDVYFYFTDEQKAWDFFLFQDDIDNEGVNWDDYE